MSLSPFTLLKHLDAPVRFLSFTATDVIAYVIPFLVGACFDSVLIIPILGSLFIFGVKKFLKNFPKFYGIRLLYWCLPTHRFNRILHVNLPPSHKRLWVK